MSSCQDIITFIDGDAGSVGSFKGVIRSVEKILDRFDENTKIIPGHGPLAGKKDLERYRDMLTEVYTRILAYKQNGKSVDEVIELKPTADFDAHWGNGFLSPDTWVKIIFSTIAVTD